MVSEQVKEVQCPPSPGEHCTSQEDPLTTFLLDGTQSVPTKAWSVPTVPPTVPVDLCKEVQKGDDSDDDDQEDGNDNVDDADDDKEEEEEEG